MPLRTALAGTLLALSIQATPPPVTPSVPAPVPPRQTSPPPSQQPQPPIFRSGAELVRVDVTVLDSKGQPVKDLRVEDFELEEDGAPQRIQSFTLVDLAAGATDGRNLEITSRSQAEQELAREDVRVFLLFWDEYHIPPNYRAQLLRQAVVKFLRTMVAPTDLVAIMDPWTPMSDLQWTRDTAVLWTTALALRGREGVFTPPRNAAEENHLREYRRIGHLRAQVSLSALQSAMMHLGARREGRKAIVYFSREFSVGDRVDDFNETLDLIRTANDANVALYSINPDGIPMRGLRAGILSDIARESGGEATITNDPDVALRRAVQQSGAVYLLGYAPAPLRRDGKFHKIKVDVKRSGLHVRSRNGYWAPDEKTIAAAKAASVAAVLPSGIESALGELARLNRYDGDGPLALPSVLEPAETSALLSVDVPRLWVVRRPADLRSVLSDAPPEPTVQREFVRTDRLILRFGVSGSAAPEAQASAGLINRRGKRLIDLALTQANAVWTLDLPFASIARGDYVIALEARTPAARAAAYVPLRIKP